MGRPGRARPAARELTVRLYLSSYRLGRHGDRLRGMVGPGAVARVVANGLDAAPTETRAQVYQRTREELSSLDFRVSELDLRDFFGDRVGLREELIGTSLLWATGGNIFTLNAAFRASGLSTLLPELLEADTLVCGGYSAGAVVTASSLRGIERVDSPEPDVAIPDGYPTGVSWEGLGLLDRLIVPHVRSDHWESERIEEVLAFCRERGIPHLPLCDGEVVVVDGGGWTVLR